MTMKNLQFIRNVLSTDMHLHTEPDGYCHVVVTKHGICVDNWIYWTPLSRNSKQS